MLSGLKARGLLGGLRIGTLGAALSLSLAAGASAQSWTRITRNAPGTINLMVLLSDGTVMAFNAPSGGEGSGWYKLTPDTQGHYINGTWSALAPMADTRLYFQTQVLKDGRVYVSGGEYGTGGPKAEIYDPVANSWTNITPPSNLWSTANNNFYDCNSEILTDGSVLLMPVFPHSSGVGLRYNPATDTWSNAGRLFRGVYQDEATWTKLPDNSILTIDPFGTNSERYSPSTNRWINDSVVPVSLYDPFGSEIGGSVLLPNGKAFFIGSTPHTALYTPTGNANPGVWTAGPDIPDNRGVPDGPASMMPNGKVLCAVSPTPTSDNHFPSPTSFLLYDYTTNAFTSIDGPTGATINMATYQGAMLNLPDGTILFSRMSNVVYSYNPGGSPQESWKPVVTNVSRNLDGTYHLTGLQLNGISEGSSYGDDYQMNTNYPIVRLKNVGSSSAFYARTYNWSSTGVMTGNTPITTEFSLPPGLPAGTYELSVIANGIASNPTCLNAPQVGGMSSVVNACHGGTLALSASVFGVGPFTYAWQKNGSPVSNNGRISGANSANLSITPVVENDAGVYTCIVSNLCGNTTGPSMDVRVCPGDFNCDGFVDGFDYDDFVSCFEGASCPPGKSSDFNGDGFADGFDYDDFVAAFETGCAG